MPTNTLAAVAKLVAPLMFRVLLRTHANPLTTQGSIREWYRIADSAPITTTRGSERKAKTNDAPGYVSSKGSGLPPIKPNTKDVPASVARTSALTPLPIQTNTI